MHYSFFISSSLKTNVNSPDVGSRTDPAWITRRRTVVEQGPGWWDGEWDGEDGAEASMLRPNTRLWRSAATRVMNACEKMLSEMGKSKTTLKSSQLSGIKFVLSVTIKGPIQASCMHIGYHFHTWRKAGFIMSKFRLLRHFMEWNSM